MDVRHRQVDLPEGAIGKTRDEFVGGLRRGDAKAASAAYAPEARLLAPSSELLRGRDAIEQFWRAGLDSGISEVELVTLELVRLNGLAYEIGRYGLRLRPADGVPVTDRGMYLHVHARQPDGSWLRAVEMFNPDTRSAHASRDRVRAGCPTGTGL